MSRRRKKTVSDFASNELAAKIGKLMDNRRRVLAPFPVNPNMLYRRVWSDEERAAIRLLASQRKGMLTQGSKLRVKLTEPPCLITITLPQELPTVDRYAALDVPYDKLTFDQAEALGRWAPQWLELTTQQAELINKVKEVGAICKTYGQLHRLWPDMESFYNDAAKAALRHRVVRSPYPDKALLFEGGRSLKPQYQPEVFAQFTGMIAECLMLPENDDKEVATVART